MGKGVMTRMSAKKRVSACLWRIIMRNRQVRRRVLFQVQQCHLDELDVHQQIGGGLYVPILVDDLGESFSEIFLQREYEAIFADAPLPTRWIDIGAFGGFFSLWLVWLRRLQGIACGEEALLIEGDEARIPWMRRVIALNGLDRQLRILHGLIAHGGSTREFVRRKWMASSLQSISDAPGIASEVRILKPTEILDALPPPYDLVKIDIEGAEYEALECYPEVIRQSAYVVIEWHSWARSGGARDVLERLAGASGLRVVREIKSARRVSCGETGILLFGKQ